MKITANKWYGPNGLYAGRGPFGSPQHYLKTVVGQEDYKWIAKGPDSTYIRAAAVFPLEVEQWSHLLDVPWGLNCRVYKEVVNAKYGKYRYAFRMLIVSVEDRITWIERAIETGATAWQIGAGNTHVWRYTPPDLDEHGLEIRPTFTSAASAGDKINKIQFKDYNVDAVVAEIREGLLTYPEIGSRHGISKVTVMRIASRAGLQRNKKTYG